MIRLWLCKIKFQMWRNIDEWSEEALKLVCPMEKGSDKLVGSHVCSDSMGVLWVPLLCDCMTPDHNGSHYPVRNQEYIDGLALRRLCKQRQATHTVCRAENRRGRPWQSPGRFHHPQQVQSTDAESTPQEACLSSTHWTGHFVSESRAAMGLSMTGCITTAASHFEWDGPLDNCHSTPKWP